MSYELRTTPKFERLFKKMKIAYLCPTSILKEDLNYPYLHTKIIETFKYSVASTENQKATKMK